MLTITLQCLGLTCSDPASRVAIWQPLGCCLSRPDTDPWPAQLFSAQSECPADAEPPMVTLLWLLRDNVSTISHESRMCYMPNTAMTRRNTFSWRKAILKGAFCPLLLCLPSCPQDVLRPDYALERHWKTNIAKEFPVGEHGLFEQGWWKIEESLFCHRLL